MLNSKKAIGPVIAISLLLIVSIVAYISIQDDIQFQIAKLGVQLESKDLKQNVEIKKIDDTNIYIQNNFGNNLILNQIKVAGHTCYFDNITINEGLNTIYIGSCSFGNAVLAVEEVSLFTNYGIVSEYEVLRAIIGNPLHVIFQNGVCDFASGYVRVYGLSATDNAHAEDSDSYLYTYNVCMKHYDYNLSISSGLVSQRLFSLTEKNNSAIFIDKSSSIQTPSPWVDVNLYSTSGVFSLVVNSSSMTQLNYTCIGKINWDDVYGSHIGDCTSTLNDTIWLKLQ